MNLPEHEIRLKLQCALDDPMWPHHAEVSKDLLRGLAGLLHQLQGQALAASPSQPSSVAMTDNLHDIIWNAVTYLERLDSTQEERFAAADGLRAMWKTRIKEAASQPSAASGRELAREALRSVVTFYWDADREPGGLKEGDVESLVRAALATLTGAAPADANVGGKTLKRGTTGTCSRSACSCERDGLGDECIWLRPTTPKSEQK